VRLNLGCKNVPREGYVNVDLYWDNSAVVIDDARILEKFHDGCASEVYASHVLEHIPFRHVPTALANWRRVLRDGGAVEVIVPNIEISVRKWLAALDADAPDLWEFRSHCIWGQQTDPGEFHYWGYTEKSLREVFEAYGFKVLSVERVDGIEHGQPTDKTCLRLKAVKA
jgi:predicted SAM-dependent methyltransferase